MAQHEDLFSCSNNRVGNMAFSVGTLSVSSLTLHISEEVALHHHSLHHYPLQRMQLASGWVDLNLHWRHEWNTCTSPPLSFLPQKLKILATQYFQKCFHGIHVLKPECPVSQTWLTSDICVSVKEDLRTQINRGGNTHVRTKWEGNHFPVKEKNHRRNWGC